MEDVLKADIFFFVSTISTVVVGVLLVIVLSYLINILSDVRHVTRRARVEGKYFLDEFHVFTSRISKRGMMAAVVYLVKRMIRRYI